MSKELTITLPFHVKRSPSGRKRFYSGKKMELSEPVPRISRLMALAIQFDQAIRKGEVRDFVELASIHHVTRARVTQVMNLLNLAPDIQEELLFLKTEPGRSSTHEHGLRAVTTELEWEKQRAKLSR